MAHLSGLIRFAGWAYRFRGPRTPAARRHRTQRRAHLPPAATRPIEDTSSRCSPAMRRCFGDHSSRAGPDRLRRLRGGNDRLGGAVRPRRHLRRRRAGHRHREPRVRVRRLDPEAVGMASRGRVGHHRHRPVGRDVAAAVNITGQSSDRGRGGDPVLPVRPPSGRCSAAPERRPSFSDPALSGRQDLLMPARTQRPIRIGGRGNRRPGRGGGGTPSRDQSIDAPDRRGPRPD